MQEFGLLEIIPEMARYLIDPGSCFSPPWIPSGCTVGGGTAAVTGDLWADRGLCSLTDSQILCPHTWILCTNIQTRCSIWMLDSESETWPPVLLQQPPHFSPPLHSSLAWKRGLCSLTSVLLFAFCSLSGVRPRSPSRPLNPRPSRHILMAEDLGSPWSLSSWPLKCFFFPPFSEDAFFTWLRSSEAAHCWSRRLPQGLSFHPVLCLH